MKKIVAVVVTYNRKKLLKENLNALLNQSYKDFNILLIDNASTDGTKEYVKDELENEKIIYVNTGANLGGAGGFNFGVREAVERGYDYAWLMDDDTIPTETALESLVKKKDILNEKFSFLSSLCEWKDGKICEMNRQDISKKILDNIQSVENGLVSIEKATFVSFFVRLELVKKVGLPISEFFIYADDWEYSLRLLKEDNAYLDCNSIVIHKMNENKTAEVVDIPKERINRTYYDFRNTFYIRKKYMGAKKTILFIIDYLYLILRILIKSKNKKLKRIYYISKGFFAGIFFNPKIEYAEVKNK